MPRKLYRSPEAPSTPPSHERPGASSPDESGVHRIRKSPEAKVIIDPEYLEEVGMKKRLSVPKEKVKEETLSVEDARARFQKVQEELEAIGVTSYADKLNDPAFLKADGDLKHAERAARNEASKRSKAKYKENKEIDTELDFLQAGINQPTAAELVEKRDMELLSSVPNAPTAKEKVQSDIAKLKEKMDAMGGVWGGQEYFELNEEKEALEKKLRKMETGSEKTQEQKLEPVPEKKETEVMRKEKELKKLESQRRSLENDLAQYGFDTPAKIMHELHEYSHELQPHIQRSFMEGLQYRLSQIGRFLSGRDGGIENRAEVKALLKEYGQIQDKLDIKNREILEAREQEGMVRAARPGRIPRAFRAPSPTGVPGTFEGMADTFLEAPAADAATSVLNAEVAQLKRMHEGSISGRETRRIELTQVTEDIEDQIQFAKKEKDFDDTTATRFLDKIGAFSERIRKLEKGIGDKPADIKAIHDAEVALAKLRNAVERRAGVELPLKLIEGEAPSEMKRQLEEAEADSKKRKSRPMSVISNKSGTYGSFGASTQGKREVKWEQAAPAMDARDYAAERLKAVQEYRSNMQRGPLVQRINEDPDMRAKMHDMYEEFTTKWRGLDDERRVSLQTSVDPALDYALDSYKISAKDARGRFMFDKGDRDAAKKRIAATNLVLGWLPTKNIDREDKVIEFKQVAPKPREEKDYELYEEKPVATVAEAQEMRVIEEDADLDQAKEINEKVKKVMADGKVMNDLKRALGFTLGSAPDFGKVYVQQEKEGKLANLKRFDAILKEATEEAEPLPLTRVKRARKEAEIEKVEEEEVESMSMKSVESPEDAAFEKMEVAMEDVRNAVRKTFGIGANVAPRQFLGTIERNKLKPLNDGSELREMLEKAAEIGRTLPRTDREDEINDEYRMIKRLIVGRHLSKVEAAPAKIEEVPPAPKQEAAKAKGKAKKEKKAERAPKYKPMRDQLAEMLAKSGQREDGASVASNEEKNEKSA